MQEQNWPGIFAALGGFVGFAAILKVVRDWRRDQGASRLSGEQQVRDALAAQNVELRQEVTELRDELGAARQELGRHIQDSVRRLRQCEERAVKFQRDMAEMRGELSALKARHGA